MKLRTAIIVFPGSTGADDIKTACDFFDWESDLIWHKDCLSGKYDIIFLPPGRPYDNNEYSKDYIFENSNAIRNLDKVKSLITGFSDGFQMLCRMDLLNGTLDKNINGEKLTGFKNFSFLDNDVLLPIATDCGNFSKKADFKHDIILKYTDNCISDNSIAGVYDYENKVVGMSANPHLAIISKMRHTDGRKVFDFLKNVI